MKKLFKILGYLLLVIIIIGASLIGYVKVALPNVGAAPDLKVDRTPERVARGKYLANCVTVCVDCHSTRDWTKFSGPIRSKDSLGIGGERFGPEVGMPGTIYSRNITPKGISRYTDGELFRLITTGVTKEGKAIFPLMPYKHYGQMDPDDIYCIIAYIRSFNPIENNIPVSALDFPMSVIVNTIPSKAAPIKRPDADPSSRDYGAYMANAAGCIECHTKADKGQIIPELAFSGGREFLFPDGSIVRSANITPDKETGIGLWSQEAFINRFKSYSDSAYHPQPVGKGAFNSIMPWTQYANMSTQDLAAIYNYLRTVPAMQNTVVKFTPAGGKM